MKRIFLFVFAFVGFVLTAQESDPVLMTINNKKVHLSEFEYIYNKNNNANTLDKKTLDEYVDLFVVFKLKVEEAIAQGLDTTNTFLSELGMYRNQLAEQYLQVDDWMEPIVLEAYDRRKEEVHVSHIMIQIDEQGRSSDTLAAYNRAMEIYKRVQNEDFEKVAREVSDDHSVNNNGGVVGWINSMRTPHKFETVAYNTPVGTIAKPVRTTFGYHIIKVNNRRQSPGEIKAAHIMISANRNDEAASAVAKERADSLYNALLEGASFSELAMKFSNDEGSATQGGELPWFGSGQMVPEFEDASFAIANDGDITEPVQSAFGWHIIKRIERKPLEELEEMRKGLEARVIRGELSGERTNSFTRLLKDEYNFSENPATLQEIFELSERYALNDSNFLAEAKLLNKELIRYDDKVHTQDQFIRYIEADLSNTRGVRTDFLQHRFNDFVNDKLINYEKSRLATKYPDYRNLMQEYHDGILLFDIMNREVWEKASQDKEGLESYFEQNRTVYNWDEPRYKGRVIYAKDKATVKAAKRLIKVADPDSIDSYLTSRLNDSIKYVRVERGLWRKGDNKTVDQKVFKTGKFKASEEYPYVILKGKLLKKPEEYVDVRGQLTTNYQDYLEEEWIKYLRNKYIVDIDEKVLKTVKKN